jgi:predicted O-linked N-acetylglucosamine transferase (SPINDLY family)
MISTHNIHTSIQTLHTDYDDILANHVISYLDKLNVPELEGIRDSAINAYLLVAKNIIKSYEYSENVDTYMRKILSLDPEHESAFEILKLNCILKCKCTIDFKSHLHEFTELLIYHPGDFHLQFLVAMTYYNLYAYDDAIQHLKLTMALVKNKKEETEYKVKCMYYIAQIYYKLNNMYLCHYYVSRAYEINSDDNSVNNLLGIIYVHMRHINKAIWHFEKIPDDEKTAAIYSNLGTAYSQKMDYEKAIQCYDKIPDNLIAFQNKLLMCHYILNTFKDDIYLFELHKQINKFYPNSHYKKLTNYIKKPHDAKLKIGFVSSDFIYNNVSGVVMHFLHNILHKINKDAFDIVCYSPKPVSQIQSIFPKLTWRYIHDMPMQEFKDIIQNDSVDILFDMSGYTSEFRLDIFAERAAPIQISYCGYPNTTGLENMDYHIVDRYCDSDGITPGPGGIIRPSTQRYYTEKLIFMDKCFISYNGITDNPIPLLTQPCMLNKYLTIGTCNKLNKMNQQLIKIWQTILQKCSNIHLIVKTIDLATPELKEEFMQIFDDKDVHERIILSPYSQSYTAHLMAYNNIDIALDTFPYSGTCTTCDALYMGVPVITLFDSKRQYHVQNVSSSILVNAGLSEYICFSEEEYIDKVIYYANHMDELYDIKTKVRKQFLENICNAEEFVQDFENKIRHTYENHDW